MNDLETAIQEILDSISRGEVTKQTDWDIIMETLQASTDAERINNIHNFILDNFSFMISENAEGIVYYGKVGDTNSVPIYKLVNGIVDNSPENYGFISSTQAGKLFNDEGFKAALRSFLEDEMIVRDFDRVIYNGNNPTLGAIKFADGTSVQAFNDFFSVNYVSHLKCSNIETLMSAASPAKCSRSEILSRGSSLMILQMFA